MPRAIYLEEAAMLSWLGQRFVSYLLGRLNAGDLRPLLMFDSPDVEMTFPGDSTFAGIVRGRDAHERWLRRFVALGIQISADEVVIGGFPWSQTMCVRGTDQMRSGGELVYFNRYVIWAHMKWGRIRRYEVYEDTQQTAKFDAWLAANRPALAAA